MAIARNDSARTDSLIVERMKPDDADSVVSLFTQVVKPLPYYSEEAKASELAKYTTRSLQESLLRDPDAVLVARNADRIVGFCLSNNDDGVIWLDWFGVDAKYRRLGVGSSLLHKLEETVRAGRSHKIWCDCRTENENSKRALSKHGYIQLCTIQNHWYGQDFILWEKLVS